MLTHCRGRMQFHNCRLWYMAILMLSTRCWQVQLWLPSCGIYIASDDSNGFYVYINIFLQSYCRTSSFHDGCYYFGPYSNGYCNSPLGMFWFKYVTIAVNTFIIFAVPITNSCFPLVYSDGTQRGRCYNHQCYMYPGAQMPFYTVTRFG